MSKKATEEELAELHGEFARYLKSFLKRTKAIMDRSEDEDMAEPNASVLNVVKGFLKDNHIELDPKDVGSGQKGDFEKAMEGLGQLPFETNEAVTGSR